MGSNPQADLVTQLQLEINRLSELLYATVGELQRDAGPLPIHEEALMTDAKEGYKVKERCTGFVEEILNSHETVGKLINKLPNPPGPVEERLRNIASLQQQDAQLQDELEKEHEAAEMKLRLVQEMYATLVQQKLRQRST